jgi:uncharacterized protein
MSQANVEIIQMAIDAFERGNNEGVLRLCDENIEITQAAGFLGVPQKMRGHAGVLEAFDAWPEQWDDYRIETLRVADFGDHVMITQLAHGRGRGSGVEVEMPLTLLFALRDGKIIEWQIYSQEQQALEALGLEA